MTVSPTATATFNRTDSATSADRVTISVSSRMGAGPPPPPPPPPNVRSTDASRFVTASAWRRRDQGS